MASTTISKQPIKSTKFITCKENKAATAAKSVTYITLLACLLSVQKQLNNKNDENTPEVIDNITPASHMLSIQRSLLRQIPLVQFSLFPSR